MITGNCSNVNLPRLCFFVGWGDFHRKSASSALFDKHNQDHYLPYLVQNITYPCSEETRKRVWFFSY